MAEIRCAYLGTASSSRLPVRATNYSEQSTNAQRSFSSTSASDTGAGVGARTIELTYYDQDMNGPYTEILTLSGTTPVDSVATDICLVEKIEVIEVGSSGTNVGAIRIHTATSGGGSVFASIAAGDNRTRFSHHYIPAGRTFNLQTINASCVGTAYLLDTSARRYGQPVGSMTYAAKAVTSSIRVDPNSPATRYTFADPYQIVGPAKFELFARCDGILAATIHADFSFYEV